MSRTRDAFDVAEKLHKMADKGEAQVEDINDKRPKIILNVSESHVAVQKAIELLSQRGGVFQRASRIVTVETHDGEHKVATAQDAKIEDILSQSARWFKHGKDGPVEVMPPEWLVRRVSADGTWRGINYLDGVIEWPAIRRDWSIIQTPGYDPASKLIYSPSCQFETIPDAPDQAAVMAAKDDLMDVIQDFPMDGDEHRAAWLAALLTIMGRNVCPGPTPLFLISANVQGVGKSMIADVMAAIALGKPMLPRVTYTDNEPEMRKNLTSHFLEGTPAIFLDNCEGQIGCPPLSAAITGMYWKDRLLGTQDVPTLGIRSVFLATGNNIKPSQDLIRRIVPINMTTQLEHPERRQGFKHSPLIRWVMQERPRLVVSAMIILRGYFSAGKPRANVPPLGSFDEWEDIRQAVIYTGLPDPLKSRATIESEGSQEALFLERVINTLAEEFGLDCKMNSTDILAKKDSMNKNMRDLIAEWGTPRGPVTAQSIGKYMSRHMKVVVKGRRINCSVLNGRSQYFIEEVTESPSSP